MLSYGELKKGVLFVLDGDPYEVLESGFLRMQQRKAVMQTTIRNLITGKVVDRNWQASDYLEEADVERKTVIFLYSHRDEFWFSEKGNPKARFSLTADRIGASVRFLKPNTGVEIFVFRDKVIKLKLPIKMEFKVIEAPPAVRGNTAQGGTKSVTVEGGTKISAPLFINEGDVIRVNTETGEYVERAEKQ